MERSRADRILGDWDRISRQARRPGLPTRRAVNSRLPASTMTSAAILVVVVVAAGLWFGLPARVGPPAGEPTASPASTWGPLAVIPPQGGADQARTEGTLRITEACVFLERAGEVELLFWPADRTTWSEESRAITFENYNGSVVTVGDGDAVILGGGGDSEAESGISGEEWVSSMDWVQPPASSCTLDPHWGVGAVEHSPAADQSSGPSAGKPAGTGGPLIIQTDPPPDTGLLGPVNAPVGAGVFTPTNAWAGWTSPTTFVAVYAGESPDQAGHGLMFVIRRPGTDGQHLDPDGSPSTFLVSPPTEGGRLTIDRVQDGKLIVRDLEGIELTFDPVSARFLP